MLQPPEHFHDESLWLSEVLDDIGVNQRLLKKRQRSWFLHEEILNVELSFMWRHTGGMARAFHFGSQTEGSTTLGLHSDLDTLYLNYLGRVIPDLSEWKPFTGNFPYLLMVQDQTTAPGYCLLQAFRNDVPLPLHNINRNNIINNIVFTTDCRGRVLLKHDIFFVHIQSDEVRHGPAGSENYFIGNVLGGDDTVSAIYCSYWPREADPWLQQQNPSGWPTEDLKRSAAQSGCILVPVASRDSEHEGTEWRISTCLAERSLMDSLNMTQLRCYVLLKMITKSYFHSEFKECVTSYICKTVLFHCIANSRDIRFWCDKNLLLCLNTCLQHLSHCIRTKNCPHFIIPGNNLLRGKLSPKIKQQLTEKINSLTGDIVRALEDVRIDNLGTRLCVKSGRSSQMELASNMSKDDETIVSFNQTYVGFSVCVTLNMILTSLLIHGHRDVHRELLQIVSELSETRSDRNFFEITACKLIVPFLYTTLGSLFASADIAQNRGLSPQTLEYFSSGLDSDVASSRLKQASALYSAGEFGRCESILKDLERKFITLYVWFICPCRRAVTECEKNYEITGDKNEENVIKENFSFCVKYLPSETCMPSELKYELFRSTGDDIQYRGENTFWMNLAVVDSRPYMYFLQFKVYSQLKRPEDQQRALDSLASIIKRDTGLGHKETALNLLGQCCEQENRIQDALCCYIMSLRMMNRNNAAKWHICKLLAAQVRQKQPLL